MLTAATNPARPAPAVRGLAREHSGVLVRMLYVLFAAAVILEQTYEVASYPDDIGSYLPFFQDFATWTHVKGLSWSLAEIFMGVMLLCLLFKATSERGFRFDRGSLMRPLGLYMLMVLVAEVHGLTSGGNMTLSLWEVRSQAYMFVAYVLTCNLVKTRRQVNTLVWILLVGTALKGIQGVWRYQVDLQGNIHTVESIFPHEQSFFFSAFLTLAPILFLYGGSPRIKRFVLCLLPFVAVAALANQRRAAVLALIIGVVGLLIMTAIAHPARRRVIITIGIMLVLAWPPYYAAFKNSTGLTGEIAHAVNSNSNPNARDQSSNVYRDNESADIKVTVKSSTTSQIIGYGYGKPMMTPYPLADISGLYVFWNIMPHNSIYWVWMRLGTVGYILLWYLVGLAVRQAASLARRLKDPYLKGLAVWIALMVIEQVIFAFFDLQWTAYRNMIILGVLLALISRLTLFAQEEVGGEAQPPSEPQGARGWRRMPYIRPTLAVVNGRLQ